MVPVRRGYGESDYGQIHYRLARPPEPTFRPGLVCLHQSPKSGRDFHKLIARLGSGRACLAPDTPGYGESDAPPAPPSLADYGAAILACITALQNEGALPPGPVDLLGYHTGSAIAAWIARHHPQRVRRLVFVSLPALTGAERAAMLAALPQFPVPRADAGNIHDLWALTETLNDPRLDPEWRHMALGECLRTGHRLPWGFRAVFSHDHLGDLAAIAQPALVLCPADDLREQTLAHADRLANGRLIDLPAAGNGFLDLDTAVVADLLEQFLDG